MYAPLRTAIYEGSDGGAFFVIDQPSALFGSFGNADITEVGRHLDALVATLLDALGAVVPAELSRSRRPDGSLPRLNDGPDMSGRFTRDKPTSTRH